MDRKKSFTLIELLVVVAIIAVLVAILLPALNKARETARQISCESQLREQGAAFTYYFEDNNGVFPVSYYWHNPAHPEDGVWWLKLTKYLAMGEQKELYPLYQHFNPNTTTYGMFGCPSDTNAPQSGWVICNGPSYGFNRYLSFHRVSEIDLPSTVIIGGDSGHSSEDLGSAYYLRGSGASNAAQYNIYPRHGGMIGNVLWVDCHVSAKVNPDDFLFVSAIWRDDLKLLP